jgi:hypothetical protein
MKRILVIIVVLAISLFIFGSLLANEKGKNQKISFENFSFGSFETKGKRIETSLEKITEEKNILALFEWGFDQRRYVCIVTSQKRYKPDSIPERAISFYKNENKKLIEKYSYKTYDWFSSLFPIQQEHGNLFTIWGGGSAYHFVVFSMSDNEVKIVLQIGAKQFPEFIDFDNDGEMEIVITEGELAKDYRTNQILSLPESARLFKWNGNSYDAVKSSNWENRLCPQKSAKE